VARSGMVRTFQLTKALSRMTVMDNMMLGAQGQAGENLLKSMFKPLWGRQEGEIEAKAMDLLDRFSDNPAVVSALREFRARIHYPPGLQDYLVPATNEETLASLAGQIELLLADQETDHAVEVAAAALDMIGRIAPVAEELDPNLGDLGRRLEQVRERLVGAVSAIYHA